MNRKNFIYLKALPSFCHVKFFQTVNYPLHRKEAEFAYLYPTSSVLGVFWHNFGPSVYFVVMLEIFWVFWNEHNSFYDYIISFLIREWVLLCVLVNMIQIDSILKLIIRIITYFSESETVGLLSWLLDTTKDRR